MPRLFVFAALSMVLACGAQAGEADVLSAEIRLEPGGLYTVHVEVEHADDGWDHYADAWQVVAPDGAVLATRRLAHPHVNEQPFIRSKSGIEIPDGIETVTIRARGLVHGFGGREVQVTVPRQ